MNGASPPARSDEELLRITEAVLLQEGFHVETVSEDIDLVLAENHYFVLAVAAITLSVT